MRKFHNRRGKYVFLGFLCIAGLTLRLFLSQWGNRGDIEVFAEWGRRFWDLGARDFYFDDRWYFSFPTYPPFSSLIFAAIYWMYEKRYLLAEIHNAIKIIPSSFIIYFSEIVPLDPFMTRRGYYLLLKAPSIISDIAISLLIYKLALKVGMDVKKAVISFLLYLFSPVTVFLSSIWGQNDSLVALFGFLSFYLLHNGNISLALPSMMISLLIKPTWAVSLPVFFAGAIRKKFSFLQYLIGMVLSGLILVTVTIPFSGSNVYGFTKGIVANNILPSAKGLAKASISAFNFHSLVFDIDKTLASVKFFGVGLDIYFLIFVLIINAGAVIYTLLGSRWEILLSAAVANLGAFVFLTNMLDRYFFSALPFIVVISSLSKRYFWVAVFCNIVFFANLIWAYYRRSVGIIDHTFSDNNFLVLRVFSLAVVVLWFYLSWNVWKKILGLLRVQLKKRI